MPNRIWKWIYCERPKTEDEMLKAKKLVNIRTSIKTVIIKNRNTNLMNRISIPVFYNLT
jgi:hypothetical protein